MSLDAFDPITNAIHPKSISHAGLSRHVEQYQGRYERTAAARRKGLIAAGYLSAGDARAVALKLITDNSRGRALGAALAARFAEIVVDEGQDCNPLDFDILNWLRENGVQLSLVCDPDQSIYEFRHGSPQTLSEFRNSFAQETIHPLTGNFRSTVAICRLSSTLRNSNHVDDSVGDHAGLHQPVILLSYKGKIRDTIGRAFIDHVKAAAIAPDQAIVLAHAAKSAQRAAGDTSARDSSGNSRVELFARCVAEYWSVSSKPRLKEKILQSIEKMLLDLSGLRENNEHITKCFQRTGLNRRIYRRKALELITGVPKSCPDTDAGRTAWIGAFYRQLDSLELVLPAGQFISKYFPSPRGDDWSSCLQKSSGLNITWATIHEAKGHEYEAVCVVVPPNQAPQNRTDLLMGAWMDRTENEAKRVLYVGVTRAMKLVLLAVPSAFAGRCADLLFAGQVPYIQEDLSDTV